LIDSNYWQGLINWLRNVPLDRGTISATDLDTFTITDDVDEAVALILTSEARLASPRRPE
jgi:predicted Rossmann-fold nucleotide-binding protein